MTGWLSMALILVFCFVVTFLMTFAIREGGSLAFLQPARWRKRAEGPTPETEKDLRP